MDICSSCSTRPGRQDGAMYYVLRSSSSFLTLSNKVLMNGCGSWLQGIRTVGTLQCAYAPLLY